MIPVPGRFKAGPFVENEEPQPQVVAALGYEQQISFQPFRVSGTRY
jgi:hypothetical protein